MANREGKTRESRTRKGPQWEDIAERAYDRLSWYATRFMIIGSIGVVIGFVAIVYAILSMVLFGSQLQDFNVFLGSFVGLGAIVASLVLIFWGFFWRRKVDQRTIF